MIPIIEVRLQDTTRDEPVKVACVDDADKYVQEHPDSRFEFTVRWKDGSSQLGRVSKGKTVSGWLTQWASHVTVGPVGAPEPQRSFFVKEFAETQPDLLRHARRILSGELAVR